VIADAALAVPEYKWGYVVLDVHAAMADDPTATRCALTGLPRAAASMLLAVHNGNADAAAGAFLDGTVGEVKSLISVSGVDSAVVDVGHCTIFRQQATTMSVLAGEPAEEEDQRITASAAEADTPFATITDAPTPGTCAEGHNNTAPGMSFSAASGDASEPTTAISTEPTAALTIEGVVAPAPGEGEPGSVYIGTAGFTYAHWRKGIFYPASVKQADELKFYAGVFPGGFVLIELAVASAAVTVRLLPLVAEVHALVFIHTVVVLMQTFQHVSRAWPCQFGWKNWSETQGHLRSICRPSMLDCQHHNLFMAQHVKSTQLFTGCKAKQLFTSG